MSAQASLPGCAPIAAGDRAADADLRGEVALCLMALLTWGESHGGLTPLIDGTVARFIAAPGPADPAITRAIDHTRAALARYVATGAAVPAWLPPSVLALLTERPNDERNGR